MSILGNAREQLATISSLFVVSLISACGFVHAVSAVESNLSGIEFDLQAFIDKSVANGDSTIIVPPGRYRVTPKDGVHLRLDDLHDLTIVADGVEMICTKTTRAIEIEGCEGLTLKGLSIDYDPLPFTQGRIVKLSSDKSVHEIEILRGYPEADKANTKKYQIYGGDDHKLKAIDYYSPKIEALSKKRLRITKTQHGPEPLEEVGDLVVISAESSGRNLPHAVFLDSCKAVKLEAITVFSSNCFAFLENNCDRSEYLHCRVERRDLPSDFVSREIPRLRSANADGFHSKRAIQGPQIVGCYAHYQGDDCVNINGDYHVIANTNGDQLRVIAKQTMDIAVGDKVQLVKPNGGAAPGARVLSVRKLGLISADDRTLIDSMNIHPRFKDHEGGHLKTVYLIGLNREIAMPPGSLISAFDRQGRGSLVAECDFGHVRSRGIIVKARDCEIRDNLLTECRSEAIRIAPEAFWLEAGSASNLSILSNTITGCGSVGIAVYARGTDRSFAPRGAHRDIKIMGNTISDSAMPSIFVSSTTGLEIEGNQTMLRQSNEPSRHVLLRQIRSMSDAGSQVATHNCKNITEIDNLTR